MKFKMFGFVVVGFLVVGVVVVDSCLDVVLDCGKLFCFGYNGFFFGFVEVDDKGNWKGMDIDLCKGLVVFLFGKFEGNLEIVFIFWV